MSGCVIEEEDEGFRLDWPLLLGASGVVLLSTLAVTGGMVLWLVRRARSSR